MPERRARPAYRVSAAVLRVARVEARSAAASSPASRFRGASPRATTISAAITSSGRAIWSRSAGGLLAVGAHARMPARAALPAGDAGSRRPLVAEHVARRHAVLERHPDGRDGAARSCWSISRAREGALTPDEPRSATGRWCGARPAFSSATARSARRIAGRKMPGYSPFTLAAEIAALLVAADLADASGEPGASPPICARRPTPGTPASSAGCTSTGTALARRVRRRRLLRARRAAGRRPMPRRRCTGSSRSRTGRRREQPAPAALIGQPRRARARALRPARRRRSAHREHGEGHRRAAQGRDAARAGVASLQRRRLRRARRRHARSTAPASGRPWPLLTGERAHYELAAGRTPSAERLLRIDGAVWPATAACCPSRSGTRRHSRARAVPRPAVRLGDAARLGARRIPQAAPLAAATGASSTCRRRPCERYLVQQTRLDRARSGASTTRCARCRPDRTLRIETLAPADRALERATAGARGTTRARDSGLGVHYVDLPTARLQAGTRVEFTFYWPAVRAGKTSDFAVDIE